MSTLDLLSKRKKEADLVLNQINTLKNDADKNSNEISDLKVSSTEKLLKMDSDIQVVDMFIKETFNPLKEKVDNKENGVEATFNSIKEFRSEAENKIEEIGKIEEIIKKQQEENGLIAEKSKELQLEAEKMLGLSINKALSDSFQNRIDELKVDSRFWWNKSAAVFAIFITLTGLTLILPFIFTGYFNFSYQIIIIKISLLIPLALFAWIFFKEALNVDKKIENYAFRRTITATLQSNIALLESKFLLNQNGDDIEKGKILDFAIETMKGIYKEPISDKTYELELKAKIKEYEIGLKTLNKEDNKTG